jgi:hypothetical protein
MEQSKLQRHVFAGALVLGSILPACVAAPDDIADEDLGTVEQAETTSGSGSGSGSGSANPCWPTPSCTPSCNRDCGTPPATCAIGNKNSGWAKTIKTVQLLATRYEVSVSQCGPFTLGYHTGLGVRNKEATTAWSLSCDGGLQTTSFTGGPYEGPLTYNHGRTYDPAVNTVVDTFTFDTGTGQPTAYEDAIWSCLGVVQDGFCDSVCGNDAYTVPSAAISRTSNTTWLNSLTTPFTGRMKYGNNSTYWGYANATANFFKFWGNFIRVPYYGHNSNNDANAVKGMFGACRAFKSWLDGNCNVLADSNRSCGPNWSLIQSQINKQIRSVCKTHCGGLQLKNGAYYDVPNAAADSNVAARDSNMSSAPVSSSTVCPNIQPWSGNFLEGPWPDGIGQVVKGM